MSIFCPYFASGLFHRYFAGKFGLVTMSKRTSNGQLATFLSWKVQDSFGYETKRQDGRALVSKVWCKSCSNFSDKIARDYRLRGQAKLKFVEGTEFVTKHTVTRHLESLIRFIIYT